ncbi:MAG: cell division protein FtsL [Desulfobacteraceae bacterium]|nr:cell division protein FtsL [Desulfobacteraceae bacterium]
MAVNKKKATPKGKRMTGTWVIVLSLFIAELLFYTWCRVQYVQVGICIGQVSRQAKKLKTLNNSLKIEMARLKAPERISHIARTRLKMKMPEHRQIIVLP